MTDLIPVLIPLLLVDVLNPVLFAALIYTVGTSKPVLHSSALLAGHTAAYFMVGIVVALGLEKVSARIANPEPVDFVVAFLVGLGCLYAALASRSGGASNERQPEGELTTWTAFTFGAILNFVGAPFAVPYFAAVGQVLRADLSVADSLVVLAAYNFAYAAPFLAVPIFFALVGASCKPVLEKINVFLTKGADAILPFVLGLLGAGLVADAVLFFVRGEGLF